MFYMFSKLAASDRSQTDISEERRVVSDVVLPSRRVLHAPPKEIHNIDFWFIHDAAVDSIEAWKTREGDEEWLIHLFNIFPSARFISFGYKRDWAKSLGDLVSPEHLHQTAKEFLKCLDHDDNGSSCPLVVFAHGFGGLLYEQVAVWSLNSKNALQSRKHTAFLFGTPHFGAGIAEWAIIIAKAHGIHCSKTAQAQDWSNLKDQISKTSEMQKKFRAMLKKPKSGVKTIGCFSTLAEPQSNLVLSSEWAILPEFIPIAINSSHSSMTKISPKDKSFETITAILKSLVQELTTTKSKPTPIKSYESLSDRLFDSLIKSAFNKRRFLPEGFLNEFITVDVIQKELSTGPGPLKPGKEVVDFVFTHARKLFAIMVYCGIDGRDLLYSLKSAQGSNFSDRNLPIPDLNSLPRSKRPLLFWHWDKVRLNRFREEQWSFMVPVFSRQNFSMPKLDADSILPFISVEASGKLNGPRGRLLVKLHKSHLLQSKNSPTDTADYAVIKEISDAKEWRWRIEAIERSWNSIPEYMVKPIAAFTIEGKYYIMYECSLQDYWESSQWKSPSADIMRVFLLQLQNLAQNISYMPVPDISCALYTDWALGSILKPPVPLSSEAFKPVQVDTTTSTSPVAFQSASPKFSAPLKAESSDQKDQPFDFWSLACIMLESVIFVLYGYNEVEKFRDSAQGHSLYSSEEKSRFKESLASFKDVGMTKYSFSFSYQSTTKGGEKVQTSALITWMQRIERRAPKDPSAVGDILKLIQGLLERAGKNHEVESHKSHQISTFLDQIIEHARTDERYALSDQNHPQRITTFTLWPRSAATTFQSGSFPFYAKQVLEQDDWQFILDNDFAEKILQSIQYLPSVPPRSLTTDLCERCRALDFLDLEFRIYDSLYNLSQRSPHCKFCKMLLSACKKIVSNSEDEFYLERIGSNIHLAGKLFPPVLSMFGNKGLLEENATIQLGLPQVLENEGKTFEFIKNWLEDCDVAHPNCHSLRKTSMPARLIDVRDEVIRLREFKPDEKGKYVALSHMWGTPPPGEENFITRSGNVEPRIKVGIHYEELPRTFQDAITTTRGLGIRYIWIDAICTIFDSAGDFADMCMKMEEIFSGAFCVLSVCRSRSQFTGFLGPRPQREFIALPHKNNDDSQLYICEAIDDFNRDVLQSPLHRRAWVLQERVAARRSVFFTDHQLYLECGSGMRCETLSLMYNQFASYLGDAQFPSLALTAPLVDKITLFQSLYSYYSRLKLSMLEDRPFAISVIESRLAKAFNVCSTYGIFGGSLLHYSLLWFRESTSPLRQIDMRGKYNVPSWSWMAYDGPIDYLTPALGTVEWDEFISINHDSDNALQAALDVIVRTNMARRDDRVELEATAWPFDCGEKVIVENFILDDLRDSNNLSEARCVVLGKTMESTTEMKGSCYVLIVSPVLDDRARGRESFLFRRIGLGFLPSEKIDNKGAKTVIRII